MGASAEQPTDDSTVPSTARLLALVKQVPALLVSLATLAEPAGCL